jgi:hypothetical protein
MDRTTKNTRNSTYDLSNIRGKTKYMHGETMECKGDAGNMVYAVGAIDGLYYIIVPGAWVSFIGMLWIFLQYWLPIIRKTVLSYESLCLYVLLTLLSVMIGIVLGYIQNNIQYKEVMRRTDKLAKIKRAQEDFPRYGLYTLALYTTRSFLFYLANIIFDILLSFILLGRGAFRLSIVPFFIGLVYTISSLLWWKLSHRKRITRAPGFKTPLDI